MGNKTSEDSGGQAPSRKRGLPPDTSDGRRAKAIKTVHRSEKHQKFSATVYIRRVSMMGKDEIGCISLEEFQAALPPEYWTSKDPADFPVKAVDTMLFPHLHSKNGPAEPLPSVMHTIAFLEKIVGPVEAYSLADSVQLRGYLNILRSAPHVEATHRVVLDLTDPIVRRLHDHAEEEHLEAKARSVRYKKGGKVQERLHEIAVMEAAEQEKWCGWVKEGGSGL
ncbi:uncharacterized protein EI97DRAFT_471049 [Westerdykella ornata]|uniref:Uncharacterized protein n=1 Tax=Westerdykella ornata TaxID=318751 RepID=A0A6A6J8U2_WESOR|nr:uncharacterized protein EI97DRAFT_471049 [Westerdykella ornata]KAF2271619.1 hypothetical protein EI97DRAFT_471049 [Westerdykella ornata]